MTSHPSIPHVSLCLCLCRPRQQRELLKGRWPVRAVGSAATRSINHLRRCCLLLCLNLPSQRPIRRSVQRRVVWFWRTTSYVHRKMRARLGLQPDDIAVQGAPGSHGPASSPLFPLRLNFARCRVLIGAQSDRTARSGKWLWWAENLGQGAACNLKLCGAWTGICTACLVLNVLLLCTE